MASAVLFEYVSSAPRTRVRGHFERVVLEQDLLLLMAGNADDVAGEEALRRAVRERLAEDERCRAREEDAMREEERRQRAFDTKKTNDNAWAWRRQVSRSPSGRSTSEQPMLKFSMRKQPWKDFLDAGRSS